MIKDIEFIPHSVALIYFTAIHVSVYQGLLSWKNHSSGQQQQISFGEVLLLTSVGKTTGPFIEVQGPILNPRVMVLRDNLSGSEKAVQVKVKSCFSSTFEVVHSLAKWKRKTLGGVLIFSQPGLYTDMKALRPDEDRFNPNPFCCLC